ncbi:MAG: DUF1549 and DUF1553 domain-containing protein [Opitutales bacterium]
MKAHLKHCLALISIGAPSLFATYSAEQLNHWAFQPLLEVKVEASQEANPIDFILDSARQEKGVTPNPQAKREILVRRAYMALIGLPPTPEEIDAFVHDPDPDAFNKLVDTLLASKHYGERWGRHWLDVARYGDSNGYRYDDDQPTAYHYRDFVIQALNKDMPYDQFVQWQIAGNELAPDNLEAVTANGFLAVGPIERFEGSPDGVKLARYNELDDLIGTTSSAMLGLTMSCARCHDHKFDPLTIKEYYQMAHTFNSGGRRVIDVERAMPKEQEPSFKKWLDEHEAIKQAEADWFSREGSIVSKTLAKAKKRATELENLALENYLAKKPKASEKDFRKIGVNDYVRKHKILSKEELAELKKNQRLTRLLDPKNKRYNPLVIKDQLSEESIAAYRKIADRRKDSERYGFSQHNKVLTYADKNGKVEPTFVLNRGLVTQVGEQVELKFIDVLTRDGYTPPERPEGSSDTTYNRTALAHWLTDADKGAGHLLARVMINRMWLYHFGEGLVRTPNDFGTQGDIPERQDLLDYLAQDFIDSGWQIKRMHRLMMSSATYQQTSEFDDARAALDPENRSWWRRRAIRATSEVLRDSILAVSGELNTEQFGQGNYLPVPKEAVITRSAKPYPQDIADDEKIRRRSIYAYVKRTVPVPILQLFDGADASVSCGMRVKTTVPTQALLLMNNEYVLDRSQDFAQRLIKRAPESFDAQLDWAIKLALSREVSAEERVLFTDFYEQQIELRDGDNAQALADLCQVIFNLNEFIYVN